MDARVVSLSDKGTIDVQAGARAELCKWYGLAMDCSEEELATHVVAEQHLEERNRALHDQIVRENRLRVVNGRPSAHELRARGVGSRVGAAALATTPHQPATTLNLIM